jgi:Domain of unknown function (DUF4286)
MAIIYEVNVHVKRDIEAAYRAWLVKHVEEILQLPGFTKAQCFDVQTDAGANEIGICVHYHLASQADLDEYLQQHAPRLRAEGIEKFGDGFRATRRVMLLR